METANTESQTKWDTEGYVPDKGSRQKPQKTNQWSGDRRPTWKSVHVNDNKDELREKKTEAQTKQVQEMYNKELENINNRVQQHNNWNEKQKEYFYY